jgi:hypothetical protein
MILPAGVNKATGLAAALNRMGISPHNAVAVGDAENDHALLAFGECGVAVANALPTLKEAADFVTTGARGAGVTELITGLLQDDLASHEPELARHNILLGLDSNDQEVRVRPYGENILLAGTTGSGKSALAAALLEGLCEAGYTFCVVDPDGAYETTRGAVALGSSDRPPSVPEILKLFRDPKESGVINLAGLPLARRQAFFAELLPHLTELRARTGRPHWLVIDSEQAPAEAQLSPTVLQITARPNLLSPSALADVNLVLATGHSPGEMMRDFCQSTHITPPAMDPVGLRVGEALAWRPRTRDSTPFRLRINPGRTR